MIDHGIDLWVDRIQPGETHLRRLLCRDFLRFYKTGQVGRRETPKILHVKLLMTPSFSVTRRAWPAARLHTISAIAGDIISEIGDLLFGDRAHHVGHGAVIA